MEKQMKNFLRSAAVAAAALSALTLLTACEPATNEFVDDQYSWTNTQGPWTIRYWGDGVSFEQTKDEVVHVFMPRGGNLKISGPGHFVVHNCTRLKVTLGAN